jgi:Predicted metal-binding protein (DUF2284).
MNLKQKLDNILKLNNYADKMGFSQTCLVLAPNIILDERVRIHCQINLCGNYGNNLMCPPYLLFLLFILHSFPRIDLTSPRCPRLFFPPTLPWIGE